MSDRAPVLRLLGYVAPHRKYAALTVLFGVLGFALSYAYPWIVGSVVDLLAAPASRSMGAEAKQAALVRLTEIAGLTAILHAVVVYGRGHFNVHLGHSVVTDLRRSLFDHLQSLGVGFFARERTGSILARLIHDAHEATSLIYTGIIVVGLDAIQLLIAFALLAGVSWKLTLACVALFPFYGVVFALMNPRVRRASERMHGHFSSICGNVTEQLAGQALVKTYTAEARESHRFRDDLAQLHRLVVRQSREGHLVASGGEVLVHLGTTIVLGYGGWLALHDEMTPGMMTRFLGYMLVMFGPVRRFAELNMTYQSSLSAMRRVFRMFAVEPSIVDPPRPHMVPPSRGHVRFEDVRFRYDETSAWVLDGVSLEARPGERIAVVGPSGAGKTTLVSLLPRLYDVCGGRVLVDGVDVRDYSVSALRSAIGVVQQDSFLFSGSVRDNIAYGRPDASESEVVAAAVAADAHDFIRNLPEGYETRLGERGVDLSGGQRQRISLARALLKDPPILVLDEATSSLDTESERVVQRALEGEAVRERTCFIVAHRLSTVRSADRILVIDGGRIVEVGTHDELVSLDGVYARLAKAQDAPPEQEWQDRLRRVTFEGPRPCDVTPCRSSSSPRARRAANSARTRMRRLWQRPQ